VTFCPQAPGLAHAKINADQRRGASPSARRGRQDRPRPPPLRRRLRLRRFCTRLRPKHRKRRKTMTRWTG